jgi:hypothetical protein
MNETPRPCLLDPELICAEADQRRRDCSCCRALRQEIQRLRRASALGEQDARQCVADFAAEAAMLQQRAERAEAACAALRGTLRAIDGDTADSYDLFEQRVLRRVRAALAAPDPGAELLEVVREALRVCEMVVDYETLPGSEFGKKWLPPADRRHFTALVSAAERALTAARARGWDRPAEGEEGE